MLTRVPKFSTLAFPRFAIAGVTVSQLRSRRLLRMLIATIAAALGFADVAGEAPITYALPTFTQPAFDNGYTFTGTITTDGTLGPLSPSDILAWSWTAVSPSLGPAFTVSGSSADPGSQVTFDFLIASPTDLEVPIPALPAYPDQSNYHLNFIDNAGPTNENFTYYTAAYWNNPSFSSYETGYVIGPYTPNDEFRGAGFKVLGDIATPLVVGTVPEPSSIALLTIGLMGLATHMVRRGRTL